MAPRSRGGDRVPGRGLRIEHREFEEFDENWSPSRQRAWLVKQRVGFDKSGLTRPEFVFASWEDERRLAAVASGSLNFGCDILNGASFVGALIQVREDEVLDEAKNDGDFEDGDDIDNEEVKDHRDFGFWRKADFPSQVKVEHINFLYATSVLVIRIF